MKPPSATENKGRENHTDLWYYLKFFIVWKILLLCVVFVSFFASFRHWGDHTVFTFFTHHTPNHLSELTNSWANFDGIHYLTIAGEGYSNQARFMPFYPILISILNRAVNANTYSSTQLLTAQLISNSAMILSLIFLYKLLILDHSKKTVQKSILYLALFPSAFFLSAVYSESTFLLLTVLAFYFARQKQWGKVGLVTALSLITRLTGLATLTAVTFEFIYQNKHHFLAKISLKQKFNKIKHFWSLLLTPIPLIIYSYYNHLKWGSWLYFIQAHGELGNSRSTGTLIFPLQTIYRYIKIFLSLSPKQYELWLSWIELGVFIFAVWLTFIAWKKKIRPSYLVFTITALLIPSFSGTFSGLPRYILVIFPLFLALALIKNRTVHYLYLVITIPLLILFLTLFSKGYFIA